MSESTYVKQYMIMLFLFFHVVIIQFVYSEGRGHRHENLKTYITNLCGGVTCRIHP
jgi:hypothetical protein